MYERRKSKIVIVILFDGGYVIGEPVEITLWRPLGMTE